MCNPVPVSRERIPETFAETAVHFADDLITPGKKLLHHINRPLLQRFCKDGMVCVGNRLLHDRRRLIPPKSFFINQQTHQFRNRHTRMRVIDMNNYFFRQFTHIIAETLFVIFKDILQRSTGEEIMLLQPKHFPFIMPVFRIKHLADSLSKLNLFRCLYKTSFAESAKIQFLGAPGRPHSQGIYDSCIISHYRHVVWNCFHSIVVPGYKLLLSVDFDLFNMTAKVNLTGILHYSGFPHISVF